MNIIEEFTASKRNNQALNEDAIFHNDNYVAVIDGVTNKSTQGIWSPSPGVEAQQTITFALRHANKNFDAYEMYAFLNECLKTRYQDITYFRQHPNDRLQANCIIYSVVRQEVWFFGDCHCLIDGVYYHNTKKIDTLLANLRSFVHEANHFNKVSPLEADHSRKAILPFLELQANLANTDSEFGYLVLDGIGALPEQIKIIPTDNAKTITLASDGYPILKATLTESEAALTKLRHEDPLLVTNFKATKGFSNRFASFDDRTYIQFNC
ncbi:hypothetical protein [Periweissella fabalis]|uniref:Uncharacterized protein n=1 Tax=Periweissella fabalis TaxID=1070421 RepID=A0A7X6S2A0_9LACO|nr:hypothetical protein [Periweissella fabalis]MCM0599063.1 hypothetical protein [Periweissella fabalis]NKZ23343.1 hypothetical protein [Periweissella fabalis]